MEMSRRSFLRGVLTITAVAALPSVVLGELPVIYGNGEDDDAAGLQALLDGKPFRVKDDKLVTVTSIAKWCAIYGGSFALSKSLVVDRPGCRLHISGAVFNMLPGFEGGCILGCKRVGSATIMSCTFRGLDKNWEASARNLVSVI